MSNTVRGQKHQRPVTLNAKNLPKRKAVTEVNPPAPGEIRMCQKRLHNMAEDGTIEAAPRVILAVTGTRRCYRCRVETNRKRNRRAKEVAKLAKGLPEPELVPELPEEERDLASEYGMPQMQDWIAAQEWMPFAACGNHDPGLFYPQDFEVDGNDHATLGYVSGITKRQNAAAKRICNEECAVRTECLEYALRHDERYGIWGGMTPGERMRLLAQGRTGQKLAS